MLVSHEILAAEVRSTFTDAEGWGGLEGFRSEANLAAKMG